MAVNHLLLNYVQEKNNIFYLLGISCLTTIRMKWKGIFPGFDTIPDSSSHIKPHSYKLPVFFLLICPGSASLVQAPRHPSPFFYPMPPRIWLITSYPYFLTSFSFKLRNLDNKDIFLVNENKLLCSMFHRE